MAPLHTLEWYEGQIHILGAPFSVRLVVGKNGLMACWPILRDVKKIPAHLFADDPLTAYASYYTYLRRLVKIDKN